MSDIFVEIERDHMRFESLMAERDKMICYKKITEEQGPSQQLIAFIDYDHTLGSALGLESFGDLSLEIQHSILLERLDSRVPESVALEGLRDTVIKYRKWLLVGGLFFTPALLAGIAGVAMNHNDKKKAPPIKAFRELTEIFNQALRQSAAVTAAIPTTLDEAAWKKFCDSVVGEQFETDMNALDTDSHVAKASAAQGVDFSTSGWTEESYRNALHWLVDANKKLEENAKAQAEKFDQIEKLVGDKDGGAGEVSKCISKAVYQSSKMSRHTVAALEEAKNVLTQASHHFEPKK